MLAHAVEMCIAVQHKVASLHLIEVQHAGQN